MSWLPASEPEYPHGIADGSVERVIDARLRDLGGGLQVRRVLPAAQRRLVGPFIFLDQMGPATFAPGDGVDVRPHPHIHLATVTFLFEGEIVHRDSLGSHVPIRPGALNWMHAGRGIVHSERTDPARRSAGARMHGMQAWVALPTADEETAPEFHHYGEEALPTWSNDGAALRLIAGAAYGRRAPVQVRSPLFYVEARLQPGATLTLPDEHEDRAAYVVSGRVTCGGITAETGRLVVFNAGADAKLCAETEAHVMLLGGQPLDGPRHIWWNFVSSDRAHIDRAARDWKDGRFPKVPGDEQEFIPLPE